jgi:hypothetical protein
MRWAAFWASFSQAHPVTLFATYRLRQIMIASFFKFDVS